MYNNSNPYGNGAYLVVRLNSDDSPDTKFGQGGESVVSTGPNDSDTPAGLAVDASGRVVVAGTAYNSTAFPATVSMSAARLNADGSLDSSFGSSGEDPVGLGLLLGGEFDTGTATGHRAAPAGTDFGLTLILPSRQRKSHRLP